MRSKRTKISDIHDRLGTPGREAAEIDKSIEKMINMEVLNVAKVGGSRLLGLRELGLGPFLQGRFFGYRRRKPRYPKDRHFAVLNELEKAHIYIEQLHRRLTDVEEQTARLLAIESELASLRAVLRAGSPEEPGDD